MFALSSRASKEKGTHYNAAAGGTAAAGGDADPQQRSFGLHLRSEQLRGTGLACDRHPFDVSSVLRRSGSVEYEQISHRHVSARRHTVRLARTPPPLLSAFLAQRATARHRRFVITNLSRCD